MIKCDMCEKWYPPRQEYQATKNNYCSEACREKIYLRRKRAKQIQAGNFETLTVKMIKKAGFSVKVEIASRTFLT